MRVPAVALALGLAAGAALAHGDALWIQNGQYRNLSGRHEQCCGEHDCRRLLRTEVETRPGGYWVRTMGILVPYDQAQVSEDEFFWICIRPDGAMRCFFAAAQGT